MKSPVLSLLNAESIRRYTQSGFWRDETIYAVARNHALRSPRSIAVRDRFQSMTYGELIATADRLANDLERHGLRGGQRLLLWLPTRIESVVALLACSRNGYVWCPSPHRNHTVAEVVRLIERTRAAALIYQPGYNADADRRSIESEIRALPSLRRVLRLKPAGATPILDMVTDSLPDGVSTGGAAPNDDPNCISYLAFTSGSTGAPKGVMHSDNTLLATARGVVVDWHIDSTSIVYSMSPLSHNLGVGTLITSLLAGAEFVIHDLPRGNSLLDRLVETKATYVVGVPTHAIDLLDELRRCGSSPLARVKGFRISGAAVPGWVPAELLKFNVLPQSGYGMTETCAHQYTLPTDDPRLIIETCGRTCPGYELRVWDIDDCDVGAKPGEIGEIGGRGASLMLGYFDDQLSTENSFNAQGWFMTGDLGWLDTNGYLRITGRKKDVIIRGGQNINPARIEELTMLHIAVERAAAVPVVDARLGEQVCLAVMFRAGQKASADQMLDHLEKAGLARHEMPEFFIECAEIPLMPNGKIQKRDVVSWIRSGRLVPSPVCRRTSK
jgi:acyl-CoA synthetase (AMP-forming)/AMP-acid ligase II